MASEEAENPLVAAGDELVDVLTVLLSTDTVEAIADTLGLDCQKAIDEWERVSAEVEPRP